jgi:hypothetical protein
MEWLDTGAQAVGGIAGFALALFFVGRVIRRDASARIDAYSTRLEHRVETLEAKLNRALIRAFRLESILRSAGIPIPKWLDCDDPDHLDLSETEQL